MYEGTLKIEYQATAPSEYALQMSPDHQRIEAVKNPRRVETHFRSPQLHLWKTSDTEWLLALCRPDPTPRRTGARSSRWPGNSRSSMGAGLASL